MKIEVWWTGKTSVANLETLISDYSKRIKRFHPLEIRVLPSAKKNKRSQALDESKSILKHIKKTDHIILLDEKGTPYTSTGFATYINHKSMSVSHRLIFIIGGAYGFSDDVYARADGLFSLSQMTFTHDMARVIFLEQLYRAFTILRNQPYHHA